MTDSRNRRPKPSSAMSALMSAATVVPVVAGYHVEQLIGEGGFGQVWRATTPDGTQVAIKILHLELIRSTDALTRLTARTTLNE